MDLFELADKLDPSLLWLIAFGPGFGESIAIRVPPAGWMIVDSFGRQAGPAAEQLTPAATLLDAEESNAQCLVLTHPHRDHSVGFDLLVRRYGPQMIGCVDRGLAMRVPNAEAENRVTAAKAAWAAIDFAWRNGVGRLDLNAGETMPLGSGTLTVLHPNPGLVRDALERDADGRHVDENDLSSALLVEWGQAKLVLGADLTRKGWDTVAASFGDLASHHGFKVAHHGSGKAHHDCVLAVGDSQRWWVMTPWKGGGRHLPRFEDGHGVDLLLRSETQVVLTALGQATSAPLGHEVQRREIGRALSPTRVPIPGLEVVYDDVATPGSAWAAVGFSAEGQVERQFFGDASHTIVR
jgi:beta-lactamase superfamily II metal-dependent hydrolase